MSDSEILSEQNKREFIKLFGAILRMRNLLSSFDEFAGKEILSERDFQNYHGKYLDLMDEWHKRREAGESADVVDDLVFEVELIRQIDIDIDYILALVKKYYDNNREDNEILVSIRKAVNASLRLRSKRSLIEDFIAAVSATDDIITAWNNYVAEQREKELSLLIKAERLRAEETRKFLDNAFRYGEIKTAGTDINEIMPPMSRFGGGNRTEKKQAIVEKLVRFLEKYFGVGEMPKFSSEESR